MITKQNIRQVIKANYLQPAFLVCVILLAITSVSMSKFSRQYETLPLKKPLDQMDVSRLLPYKVVNQTQIDNQDVLETLGTEEYIQWTLEDTSTPKESATRFCSLFITYYGLPDKVPHVPEECYIGGGLRQVNAEAAELTIRPGPRGSAEERQVNARYVVFAGTMSDMLGSETTFPIFYTFSVNGEYAGSRLGVRWIMNKNSFGKHSYFSKVEWKFYNPGQGRLTYPNKQESLAASEKLLGVVLPVLEKDHWPSGLW